jgi:hypothetical protein
MQVVMITNTQRKEVKDRKEERECLYSSLSLKIFKNPETRGYDHLNTPNNDGSKQGMQAVMIINTQKGRKEASKEGRKGKERKRRKKENACTLSSGHDTCVVGGCVFCQISKMKQKKQSNEFSNW